MSLKIKTQNTKTNKQTTFSSISYFVEKYNTKHQN